MTRLHPEETVFQLFDPSDHTESHRLLQWWMEITQSGDILNLLYPSTHTLSQFLTYFSSGKVRLVYNTSPAGQIRLAAWGEPVATGVIFFSLWGSKSFRHTKEGVQSVLDLYHKVFDIFHVVLGVTKQERLLKIHQKMGYKIISHVPGIWAGLEDGWLLQLTKQDFLDSLNA